MHFRKPTSYTPNLFVVSIVTIVTMPMLSMFVRMAWNSVPGMIAQLRIEPL